MELSEFLQDAAGTSSGYAEGGGLYALGLIHANHGAEIIEYLLGQVGVLYLMVHHIGPQPHYLGSESELSMLLLIHFWLFR